MNKLIFFLFYFLGDNQPADIIVTCSEDTTVLVSNLTCILLVLHFTTNVLGRIKQN
jgi:hypothetical protein